MSSPFPETIETERLVLERFCHDNVDLLEYYRICSDERIEDVNRYMKWDRHETLDETREYVNDAERNWENGDVAEYVVRPAETEDGAGELAGMCGLYLDWDVRQAILGIWLRPKFWGREYAVERAGALLDLAFRRLDLEIVVCGHHSKNEKARSAILKYMDEFGGQSDGIIRNWQPHDQAVVDDYRYSITREEYLDATEDDRPVQSME